MTPPARRPSSDRLTTYAVAGALYLAASVVVWWHVWTGGPRSVMTCGCTDAGRMVWFFEWPTYALAHGHSLLYSTWLFHPSGLNLLTDTSVPALALVLSPVTALFGPVAGVNVAATLLPASAALTMFWLLRRWVRWTPAAFVGGACYGFSAFVIVQLAFGWLNLAGVALLPLAAGCLDELLVRQRARPLVVGTALGILTAVQFFVGSELVLIAAVSAIVAVVLLAGYGAARHRADLRARVPHAAKGLGAALAVAVVLLAYPVWFFLAGPAHLGGTLWSTDVPGDLGNAASNFWSHLALWGPVNGRVLAQEAPVLGGYRGPAPPSPSFLGLGMLVVLVVGALWWRRDRRLWLFGALGLVTALLSLRVGGGDWGPWWVVYHLPLFKNVVQSRFSAVVDLCAAVMLAVIVDRCRTDLTAWLDARGARADASAVPAAGGAVGRPGWSPGRWAPGRWAPTVGAMAVAAVALVPVAAALEPNIPLVVQPVVVPQWFAHTAVHLPPHQVLATYPFATADSQASIPWQAIEGMPYQMAGGGGPTGTVARAGRDRAGFAVLRDASVPLLPAPALGAANLRSVRDAFHHWGVTMVVVPDDTGLPPYLRARGTAYGVAFFSAVLGTGPARRAGAWVWSDVAQAPPPVVVSAGALQRCLAATGGPDRLRPAQVGGCVLAHPAGA